MRTAVGDRFATLWLQAWGVPLFYETRSARQALVHPALAGLDLDDDSARRISLERARALLATGRTPQASALIERLRTYPDGSAAWELTARVRLAAGDEDGAREAVATWLSMAPDFSAALDQAHDDAALAPLVDPVHAVAPVVR